MLSRHHIRLIQVSNFLDLNIYAKTPWGPRVRSKTTSKGSFNFKLFVHFPDDCYTCMKLLKLNVPFEVVLLIKI